MEKKFVIATNNPHKVEEFKKILKALKDIAYSANSLELWAKKNGLVD